MKLSSQRFWKPKKIILIYQLKCLFLLLRPFFILFEGWWIIIKAFIFDIDSAYLKKVNIKKLEEKNDEYDFTDYYTNIRKSMLIKSKLCQNLT